MMRVLGFIHERALNLVHALKAAFCSLLYANTGLTAETLLHCLGGPWRYFTRLDGGHYQIPALSLPGDYKVKAFAYFEGDALQLYGQSYGFNSRAAILPDGSINWRAEDSATSIITSAGVVPLHVLSLIVVERIGAIGTIHVNGVLAYSGSVNLGAPVLDVLARNFSSYARGIEADVQFYSAGVLVRDYPLDEDFSQTSVVVNRVGAIGAELGGMYTLALTGFGTSTPITALIVGQQYLLVMEAATGATGSVALIYNGAYDPVTSMSAGGRVEFVFEATATDIAFQGRGAYAGDVELSVLSVEGYGTYIPHANDETLPYVEEAGGDYLGPELVVNGAFLNDSHWAVPASARVEGGKCLFTTSVGQFLTQTLRTPFRAGGIYKITATLDPGGSGFRLPYDGNLANIQIGASGINSREMVAAQTSPLLYIGFASYYTGALDDVSVKPLLRRA